MGFTARGKGPAEPTAESTATRCHSERSEESLFGFDSREREIPHPQEQVRFTENVRCERNETFIALPQAVQPVYFGLCRIQRQTE